MWGCDYNSNFIQPGGFPLFSVFMMLLFGLIFIFLLAWIFKTVFPTIKSMFDEPEEKDMKDSLRLLKMRYAKGEISEEEYNRMFDSLIL